MKDLEKKHTIGELLQWQALPLNVKIIMTKRRIRDWVNYYGIDGVYVSFSGGKDSTVLLHIAREMYPEIKAVFSDTGLEYPEIRKFVKTFDNVDIVRPKMGFKQVVERYGFPLISKEVSRKAYECRYAESRGKESYARRQFEGCYVSKNGKKNMISVVRWKFLLDADFMLSHKCCDVMKKNPTKEYSKKTGRVAITAQMASESRLRTQHWLRSGCNAFDNKKPISNPMAFWTEQDVLLYIKTYDIPIASVYGDIVVDYKDTGQTDGQLSFSDYTGMEEFDLERPLLKTTGCDRTGCILCGFGCHLEKGESRFERLAKTHPKVIKTLDVVQNNGVTYREAIE